MASDAEAQVMLAELLATLKQVQAAGVPVRVADDREGKPVLWIGLAGCALVDGAITFSSAKIMGVNA